MKIISSIIFAFLIAACSHPVKVSLSNTELLDKIKGGWAGQTIGCTYGGPTEFHYKGRIIPDSVDIPWPDGYIKWYFGHFPGLYDDVYMDLTFVDVFDRYGIDAPADSFAMAFAKAGYTLWHANQAARYNILNGMMPPESGHWLNNPHADCIDFQIEADFAGLMSPGMPNASSEICDKIGHIMNYGDGWYGGVYVAAMYSLAFIYDDVEKIVLEALKTIPEQSTFYQCIHDVINWYYQYPGDWKKTWADLENKWNHEVGCPDGVFDPFNIDAKMNAAYIVIGLLYGKGDFSATLDISTRCGQDSDCNPASAGGILGTMLGYSNIPEKWMKNLYEVEDIDFAYTNISLNRTYRMSFDQALQVIERNGGKIHDDRVDIRIQPPMPVRLEQSFEHCYPKERLAGKPLEKEQDTTIEFDGTGVVLRGSFNTTESRPADDYTAILEVYVDGDLSGQMKFPYNYTTRKTELFWKYQLPNGKHSIRIKWLNPEENTHINIWDALVYSDKI
ncbi:MAG: ADP-ribosylglycohydrolase family protein [Bacteroidales bacterium]|jgi:hypothetical protein|nr:ADP-ribosylglycohydrolase family protein [Bacteroidales bacterium]